MTPRLVLVVGLYAVVQAVARPPEGPGLAARYPGDKGIAGDPAVVLSEDFEAGTLADLGRRWNDVSNKDGRPLTLSEEPAAAGRGKRALRITATRGHDEGGHLYRVLKPGYETLYWRFYVKFAADYGFDHHFVSLGGSLNPPNWPEGRAGLRSDDRFVTGLEPQSDSYHTYPSKPFAPPDIWHFYTYWPEMRSWQNPDGHGDSFYGNDFEPVEAAVVPRDHWTCMEFMVKLNSDPAKRDGEQAFWVDGKLAAWFGPESVVGYWMRDVYRLDEAKGKPFEGLRWRTDPRVLINKVWLSHYVSDGSFERSEKWAAAHPGVAVNAREATVWFDDLVLSREYVGPKTEPGP